jgi:hypothetical protein
MSRSVRDLRQLICLSRFGFRPDENEADVEHAEDVKQTNPSSPTILFYFDPSVLNTWLELTSLRFDKLRSLSTHRLIDFIQFWLKQFDYQHKQVFFRMEFDLFVEHLLLAFTPNDTDSIAIGGFARQILHDINEQMCNHSASDDRTFVQMIDVFNRRQRDDEYRSLLANLPEPFTSTISNHLHLQWMLAIRAFGLAALSTAAVDFFEKVQKTVDEKRTTGNDRAVSRDENCAFDRR